MEEQPDAQWQAMAGSEEQAQEQAHVTPSDVQRQQEAQLAHYANLHRQRLASGRAAARPAGRSAAALDAADIAVVAAHPSYEEQLIREAAAAEPYRLPDGRLVPEMSWTALMHRAANWTTSEIAWPQRSKTSAAVLVGNLCILLLVASVLLSIGRKHLHDNFAAIALAADPSLDASASACPELPIFLILHSSLLLLMTAILVALLAMIVCKAQRLLVASVQIASQRRGSAMQPAIHEAHLSSFE